MNRVRLVTIVSILALAIAPAASLRAADADAAKKPVQTDPQRADGKANRIIDGLKLADAAKAARAKEITSKWYVTMWDWHKANDAKLKELWTQWNQARSVVPKDEFPGEIIAHQIDDAYASLKPAYQAYVTELSTVLAPEEIDALKEAWSRSPGRMRTYNAYLEIAPDLSEEQKKVIMDRMNLAREAAMLTDADREIVNLFKIHKVKVEAYVGTLEWAKLLSAYANKGKEKPVAAAK